MKTPSPEGHGSPSFTVSVVAIIPQELQINRFDSRSVSTVLRLGADAYGGYGRSVTVVWYDWPSEKVCVMGVKRRLAPPVTRS